MYFEDIMDFSKHNIYFIMGLSRPKNNREVSKEDRVFFRYPVRSADSYSNTMRKMEADCERTGLKMYIYVSVNARDTSKAYEEFNILKAKHEAEARRGNPKALNNMYRKLDKVWYGVCMKPNARGTKYFLLDIDNKTPELRLKLANILIANKIDVLVERETRNGYHWIVKPFDVRLVSGIEDVGVQKDGLLYVGCTGFEDSENEDRSDTDTLQRIQVQEQA